MWSIFSLAVKHLETSSFHQGQMVGKNNKLIDTESECKKKTDELVQRMNWTESTDPQKKAESLAPLKLK